MGCQTWQYARLCICLSVWNLTSDIISGASNTKFDVVYHIRDVSNIKSDIRYHINMMSYIISKSDIWCQNIILDMLPESSIIIIGTLLLLFISFLILQYWIPAKLLYWENSCLMQLDPSLAWLHVPCWTQNFSYCNHLIHLGLIIQLHNDLNCVLTMIMVTNATFSIMTHPLNSLSTLIGTRGSLSASICRPHSCPTVVEGL